MTMTLCYHDHCALKLGEHAPHGCTTADSGQHQAISMSRRVRAHVTAVALCVCGLVVGTNASSDAVLSFLPRLRGERYVACPGSSSDAKGQERCRAMISATRQVEQELFAGKGLQLKASATCRVVSHHGVIFQNAYVHEWSRCRAPLLEVYQSLYVGMVWCWVPLCGMAWYGMVEVCEGAPVAVSGWVLTDRHDVRPCAASSLHRGTISVSNVIGGTGNSA